MAIIQAVFEEKKHIIFFLLTSLSGLVFLLIFTPFMIDIVLAIIFALGLSLATNKLQMRFPTKKKRRTAYFGLMVLGLVFCLFCANSISRMYSLTIGEEKQTTVKLVKDVIKRADKSTDKIVKRLGKQAKIFGFKTDTQLKKQIKQKSKDYLEEFMVGVGEFFRSLPEAIMHLFIFIMILIGLFHNRSKIYQMLRSSYFMTEKDLNHLAKVAQTSAYTMLFSNIVVGSVQACVITLGATFVGFNEWTIIFFITFLCSFFPLIGTAPIGFILAGLSFLEKSVSSGVGMLVTAGIAGVVDNFLRPILVSQSEKNLHPVVGLVGIIGSIIIFGFAGLFIGPFLLTFFVSIWPYFDQVVLNADRRIQINEAKSS